MSTGTFSSNRALLRAEGRVIFVEYGLKCSTKGPAGAAELSTTPPGPSTAVCE